MKRSRRPTAATARSLREFDALNFAEQERRRKALKALSLMRNEGLSRKRAAQSVGITPSAMQKIVEPALEKRGHRYVASKGDRLVRFLVVPDARGGKREVAIRGSRQATLIAEYDNAVRRYVYTGDPSGLERFHGVTINSAGEHVPLLTDLDRIDWLSHSHQLSFESIYARIA
jgi:hypothetical protein